MRETAARNCSTNPIAFAVVCMRSLPLYIFRELDQVHVLEGDLVCPESSRKFPIKNGIPNMLLNQDEI
jgi:uncharacterized protein YbaR (Trm112 family)